MSERPLLELRSVSKTFRQRHGGDVHAASAISLTVGRGETVALVGESGSGKSSLARIALCLVKPDSGEVHFDGRRIDNLPSRELRLHRTAMQPVFQDSAAAFNPRRTVFQILEQAVPRKFPSDAALQAHLEDLLARVQLRPGNSYLSRFPSELSGGQRQRLGIARALAMNPRLIVADEPLSGADVSIRGQILNLLVDLQQASGVSYLFITHDISVARAFAHRVVVMYQGRIVEEGPAAEVLERPEHPYTALLLSAVPSPDQEEIPRPAMIPETRSANGGCAFYPRCAAAIDVCRSDAPEMHNAGPSHWASCHRLDDGRLRQSAGKEQRQ